MSSLSATARMTGPTKNADETESDKTTHDAGKNEQQRQVRAFSDQHGTQEIIHRPGDDHPHQHECSPGRFTDPIKPRCNRTENRTHSDLRDRQNQHCTGESAGKRNAGDDQPNPAKK